MVSAMYLAVNAPEGRGGGSQVHYDSVFNGSSDSAAKSSSLPVLDEPIYEDDIFEGVPGLTSSSSVTYDDVFSTMALPRKQGDAFDNLLGGLAKNMKETELKGLGRKGSGRVEKAVSGFDDLIPGFGRSTSPCDRKTSKPIADAAKTISTRMEQIGKPSNSGSTKVDGSSVNGVVFNSIDPLVGLGKSVPMFSSETNKKGKDRSPLQTGPSLSRTQTSNEEPVDKSPVGTPESLSQNIPADDQESHQTILDMHTVSTDSDKSVGQTASPLSDVNATSKDIDCQESMSLRSEENLESSGGVWLTVSDIPLLTQPTRAPPPSRPPPPRPSQVSKAESGFPTSTNARKNVNKSSSVPNSTRYFQSRKLVNSAGGRSSAVSQIDELADFTMVRTQNDVEECADFLSGEGAEMNSAAAESAAAMKEAMHRVEAKFKHAKEVKERENAKTARSEETMQDAEVREQRERQERFEHELQQREREEEERERRRLEKESENAREIEREKEEKEEQRRRREREREREREKGRQAVERATREARGRAAAEALKKAKRAAVEKANAEARERSERAAVERVQAEARERAAAEAKERAEKAAAEARERANTEAREKEARERAVFARAEAEAQRKAARAAVERAAAEARERAAAATASANQHKNENDHEAFFSMGTRPSSAHGPRSNLLHENGQRPEVERTSNGTSSSMKKASSTANIADDLTSIFGVKATPSSGELQEVESENEERHRARLERRQRTQERAAKALAEKNQRDLQAQQEQEERRMIADALDAEIKRWAAGKEGNLCALLSTLQYVLWPECGWQPVSLADLVTGASVKKAYRKATLCIHPDKVQQKGSNLQQKYIAEKVFDLLKDSWNKLNSEEPF